MITLSVLTVTLPATSARSSTPVASYSFDTVVAGVVADDTGNGHDLTLKGSWSQTTAPDGTGAVSFATPSIGEAKGADFNPGTADFRVTVTLMFPNRLPGTYTPNITEKGLSTTKGGQWKMSVSEHKGGQLTCRFKGSAANVAVKSTVRNLVNDHLWHTVSCWRSGSRLGATVDGRTTSVTATVGSIANTSPVQVAAKGYPTASGGTDQAEAVVDQYVVEVG